jgi:hypothetical protein
VRQLEATAAQLAAMNAGLSTLDLEAQFKVGGPAGMCLR